MSDLTPEQTEARIKQLSGYLVKEEERVIELQAQVAALEDSIFQYGIENTKLQLLRDKLEAENTRLNAVLDRLVEILDVVPDFTSPEFMQRRILEAIKCARNRGENDEQTT